MLGVIGGIGVVLAVAWWWWGQPEGPTPVPRAVASASALPAVTTPPSPVGASAATGSASSSVSGSDPGVAGQSTGSITVDVRGDVARPGPLELPAGSRVIDAVTAAGGATGRYGPVNLARVLSDGEQVRIGPGPLTATGAVAAATSGPVSPAASPGTTGAGALIDINTADVTELEELDGVGPVLAAAIVQWRTDNGPFTSVEDLLDVSGIGDATLAGMRDQVTVG